MNYPSHPVQGALCGVLDERLKRPTIGIRDICSCFLSQNSAECNFFSSPCVCFFPKIKEKCNYICNIFCSSFAINPRQPFMQHAVACCCWHEVHIRHDLKIFIPAQGVRGYISPSRCGLAALAFLGLFPCGTQVLGFVGFFYFDRTHCQPTPNLEREHGLRRSLPDDLIWLCSSPKTRMRLLVWTYLWHSPHSSTEQVLILIIKWSESGVLISGCTTKEVKLRQEQICTRCSFACSTTPKNPWLSSRELGNLCRVNCHGSRSIGMKLHGGCVCNT